MSTYDNQFNSFKASVKEFLSKLTKKLERLTTTTKEFNTDSTTLMMEDNTVFVYTGKNGITSLKINYPSEGNFISTIIFSTSKDNRIEVTFPSGTQLVGRSRLDFFNSETWELNIHNGRVVAAQIYNK